MCWSSCKLKPDYQRLSRLSASQGGSITLIQTHMPSFWRSNRVSKSHSFFPDQQQEQQQQQHPGTIHHTYSIFPWTSLPPPPPPHQSFHLPSAARAPPSPSCCTALHTLHSLPYLTALKLKLIRSATVARPSSATSKQSSNALSANKFPRSALAREYVLLLPCQHLTPADLHSPSRPPLYRRLPGTSIALARDRRRPKLLLL